MMIATNNVNKTTMIVHNNNINIAVYQHTIIAYAWIVSLRLLVVVMVHVHHPQHQQHRTQNLMPTYLTRLQPLSILTIYHPSLVLIRTKPINRSIITNRVRRLMLHPVHPTSQPQQRLDGMIINVNDRILILLHPRNSILNA